MLVLQNGSVVEQNFNNVLIKPEGKRTDTYTPLREGGWGGAPPNTLAFVNTSHWNWLWLVGGAGGRVCFSGRKEKKKSSESDRLTVSWWEVLLISPPWMSSASRRGWGHTRSCTQAMARQLWHLPPWTVGPVSGQTGKKHLILPSMVLFIYCLVVASLFYDKTGAIWGGEGREKVKLGGGNVVFTVTWKSSSFCRTTSIYVTIGSKQVHN